MLVTHASIYWDVIRNKGHCNLVTRVNPMIISINDVVLFFIPMVSLVAIALVSIQVDYQDFFVVEPLFEVLGDKCDVWIDAETTATFTRCMMIASCKVDGPALCTGYARRIYRALGGSQHRVL